MSDVDLVAIWREANPPVLFLDDERGVLLVKLPYADDNRAWLASVRNGRRPVWNKERERWELPMTWFQPLAIAAVMRYGSAWLVQRVEDGACCDACMGAKGPVCVCACGGRNHGGRLAHGWAQAVEHHGFGVWHGRRYGCRLVTAPRLFRGLVALEAASA
jgi:hypothetical protein